MRFASRGEEGRNDYERFMRSLADETPVRAALLTRVQLRTVLESDFYDRLLEARDATASLEDSQDWNALAGFIARGDEENYTAHLRTLTEPSVGRPAALVSEEEVQALLATHHFERMRRLYLNHEYEAMQQPRARAAIDDDKTAHDYWNRLILENARERESLGERDAVAESARGELGQIKAEYAERGESVSLNQIREMHGDFMVNSARRSGYSEDIVRHLAHLVSSLSEAGNYTTPSKTADMLERNHFLAQNISELNRSLSLMSEESLRKLMEDGRFDEEESAETRRRYSEVEAERQRSEEAKLESDGESTVDEIFERNVRENVSDFSPEAQALLQTRILQQGGEGIPFNLYAMNPEDLTLLPGIYAASIREYVDTAGPAHRRER